MEFIRSSVRVGDGSDTISLQHGFWSLNLPGSWVRNTPFFMEFLRGEVAACEIPQSAPNAAAVIKLLRSSGCLTVEPKTSFTLREISHIFEAVSLTWHAAYYQHEVWKLLRSGALSRNGLVAWFLHNYHLSRSAGITASRCALRSPRSDIRNIFLESTVEEYSHCEDYYLISDPRIQITRDSVLGYVHLPSSLAFDQQMLRIAEEDWLAHVFVGYYQERTASYYQDCCAFYEKVEDNYDIKGFFDRWKGHVQLDIGYEHASAFNAVFDSDEIIPFQQVVASLSNAAITAEFLYRALDEVVDEDSYATSETTLRLPVSLRPLGVLNSFVELNRPYSVLLSSASTIGNLILNPANLEASAMYKLSHEELDFLQMEVAYGFLGALSYSTSHQEVLYIGRIVEKSSEVISKRVSSSLTAAPSSWVAGISNFIRESSVRPLEFFVVVSLLGNLLSSHGHCMPILIKSQAEMTELLSFFSNQKNDMIILITKSLQFIELFNKCNHWRNKVVPVDIFSPATHR